MDKTEARGVAQVSNRETRFKLCSEVLLLMTTLQNIFVLTPVLAIIILLVVIKLTWQS